jgi:hypothetical protein
MEDGDISDVVVFKCRQWLYKDREKRLQFRLYDCKATKDQLKARLVEIEERLAKDADNYVSVRPHAISVCVECERDV